MFMDSCALSFDHYIFNLNVRQHKALLERKLPDALKLALAKQIENNLFSKVITQ